MSSISRMTRKEFDAVPLRAWSEDVGEFDSLVILPLRTRHDSGYRHMEFIACKDDAPIGRIAGGSDVVHIDGIGGYGKWESATGLPKSIPPHDWSIDCLPVSGLLRLFTNRGMTAGAALSSFEIYAIDKEAASE